MKVLLFDIETSFRVGAVWGMWKQNIHEEQLIKDSYILCWAAKWLGEDYTYYDALPFHYKYTRDPENDYYIVKSLRKMLDQADVVITHNGDRFDIPRINTRMAIHGFTPPSQYKSIDTLKIARRNFDFTLNRLDALGRFLKVGRKLETGGFKLWREIILNQCPDAWDKMIRYNIQDVTLLESVYGKLRAWGSDHPNLHILNDSNKPVCTVCGSEVKKNGKYSTPTQIYQKYQCTSCGHNMRSRTADKRDKKVKQSILRSI